MEKLIRDSLKEFRDKMYNLLEAYYEYLHFYIGSSLEISIWLKIDGHPSTAIITPKYKSHLAMFDKQFFDELNEKVKPAATEPDKYFYCTECNRVLPREEYADFVMAADFCKECAKKPEIANMIAESHKAGFYD